MAATVDDLPHVCASEDLTTDEWRRYWPRAFADAEALATEAAMLCGAERRAYLGRAAALVVRVFEMGPAQGAERDAWLSAFRRADEAIKRVDGRETWRVARGDRW